MTASMLFFFALGALPMWLLSKAGRWRLNRRMAALDLADQETALQGSQHGHGEIVRAGRGGETAVGLHGAQAIPDGAGPALEAGRDVEAGLGVGLGQLAAEGADRAAAPAVHLTLHVNYGVGPRTQPVKSVQVS